jgi:putative endonuclease
VAAIRGPARSRGKERKHLYILASRRRGALYIGVTNSLRTRLDQHRAVEEYTSPQHTITHAKQLKNRHRDWKMQLIEEDSLD